VSFSKVRYVDIAPLFGLNPGVKGDDIPTFEMSYARLPNALFLQILRDIRVFGKQYGPMDDHENEETRSRYLSAVGSPGNFRNPTVIEKSLLTLRQYFNQTVSLFDGLVVNTPEAILDGRITTKGRIEYHFKTYGGVTVVFIEVKLALGSKTERLDYVAQVIAECDGMVQASLDLDINSHFTACAWSNYQLGYDLPLMAVLCDGKCFTFYKFVDKCSADGSPQFFAGVFPDGEMELRIDDVSRRKDIDIPTFYRNLRKTCDAFYYAFLNGYRSGLEAYWKLSVARSKAESKKRDSTPAWHNAIVQAGKALDEAKNAWKLYAEGNIEESNDSGEKAAKFLGERYVARCPSLVVANSNVVSYFSIEAAPWQGKVILPDPPEGVENM